MGSSVHGTPFDRRSLTASATRWPANGSGSMGFLRARARPCRRAVGAGPAGRAEGCGRRACPASSPGPAEPRPPAPVNRSVGRLGAVAVAHAAALAVLALAALALAVPERAQAQTLEERLPSGDCRDLTSRGPNCGIGSSIDQQSGGL